jgi:hypothetical protein
MGPSDRAWRAIKRMFELLKRCRSPLRRKTLYAVAFELGRLVAEGELSADFAIETYFTARNIDSSDGKCTAQDIGEKFKVAFWHGRHGS